MLKVLIAAIVIIGLTIGIVKLIDKFVPKKVKPAILVVLWVVIIYLGYITFMSVYAEIKFNKLKEERYKAVIEKLIDIRDAELAHRTVTGQFQGDWDKLVAFIDTASFTLTQRRDSSVIDEELTRRYGGVETTKDIVSGESETEPTKIPRPIAMTVINMKRKRRRTSIPKYEADFNDWVNKLID